MPKWAPDLAEHEKANEELIKKTNEWRRQRKIDAARWVLRELGVE